MRMRVYHFLVNRHAGIRSRYHRFHDRGGMGRKVLSYLYLLWMNFCYYILSCRFLGEPEEAMIFEKKKLITGESESAFFLNNGLSADSFAESLSRYDIVSFDLFDTLIFRPFSEPGDLFYFLGAETGVPDFKRIRMEQEALARVECHKEQGHYEAALSQIWNHMERETGISARKGMEAECRLEMEFCYGNPFMLEVFRRLQAMGKKIIVVSDMYLPGEFLGELLEKNGYTGIAGLYVSCEYGRSKREGKLFETVRNDFAPGTGIIHVGDNEYSDVKMGRQGGFDTKYYPNVNKNAGLYRAFDMSPMTGGAYRGIVDNHIYCGLERYTMEYEYGFIYGGLFVLGYCAFIHDYCEKNGIDRVLFLSRDGEILKKAYDCLYPEEDTEYVYWSRKAAAKLEAAYDRADYFRRFLFHKVNQGYSIGEVLGAMELDFLAEELDRKAESRDLAEDGPKGESGREIQGEGKTDRQIRGGSEGTGRKEGTEEKEGRGRKEGTEEKEGRGRKEGTEIRKDDILTDRNAPLLKQYIEANWSRVLEAYRGQHQAAGAYYRKVLSGSRKAAAVDIGWAGSGAMTLRYLVSREWKIPCEIFGIVAGTNTVHSAEPDASESFLRSGLLTAYLYSPGHNRDLLKKHDPNRDYNVFWELLLSSPTPQFQGFYKGRGKAGEKQGTSEGTDGMLSESFRYLKDLDITLAFGKYDANQEGIREIQRGILDFVTEYRERFQKFPYMFCISGRDAYAPMLAAASRGERYLKAIEKKFNLEIHVN